MFTLNLSRTIHNKSNGSIKFYLTQNVEFTSHIGANFYFIKIILISNKNIKPSICRPMLIFNCSYVFSFLDELIENKLPFRMSFYLDKDFIRSSRQSESLVVPSKSPRSKEICQAIFQQRTSPLFSENLTVQQQ